MNEKAARLSENSGDKDSTGYVLRGQGELSLRKIVEKQERHEQHHPCVRISRPKPCAPKRLLVTSGTLLLQRRVVGGSSRLYDSSRVQVTGAIHALVETAMKSGDIRKDLELFDLLRALIGVSNVATGPDWQESARRLVDILIKGSRPMK